MHKSVSPTVSPTAHSSDLPDPGMNAVHGERMSGEHVDDPRKISTMGGAHDEPAMGGAGMEAGMGERRTSNSGVTSGTGMGNMGRRLSQGLKGMMDRVPGR